MLIKFVFFSTFFLFSIVRESKFEDLIIFDNFNDGIWAIGTEGKMVDHAVLALDKKMNLPSSFTICSSVHLNFMTSIIFFFQLYQDNGMPWFSLNIRSQRDLNRFEEIVQLYYYKITGNIKPSTDPVPIMPNSWYHGCTALNTVTGYMRVVVNGHIIIDQVITEFVNTDEKPKSLAGRLGLFKNFPTGFWYQSRQRLTNLNVYDRALTADEMTNLTDGENCAAEGNYLSWKEAEWNVTGNINRESRVKEEDLCYHPTSNIVLFTDLFLDWEECMAFCKKFPNTRSPSVASDKEFLDKMRALERIIMDPVAGEHYPGVISPGFWIPVTDSKVEGQWVDYYTSDPVDISGVVAGELDGVTTKNCGMAVTLWGGWTDYDCKVVRSHPLQCACESEGQMFLTMRGLYPDSNIDKYFVPQNKEYNGQTLFRGLYKTIIEYDATDNLWHLKAGVNRIWVMRNKFVFIETDFMSYTESFGLAEYQYFWQKGQAKVEIIIPNPVLF